MREFFFYLVKKFCARRIELLCSAAIREYRHQQHVKSVETKADAMGAFVGIPIIYVFPDIRNPVIGFGELVKVDPVTGDVFLQVKNYLKNETLFIDDIPFYYDESTVHSCFMVSVSNLVLLTRHKELAETGRLDSIHYERPIEPILPLHQAVEKLTNNGFYDVLRQYNAMVDDYKEKKNAEETA